MSRMVGHEYRTTTVYIDGYEGHILRGRLENPYFQMEERSFSGTMDFLRLVDGMLNGMEFPQPFDRHRSFGDAFSAEDAETRPGEDRRGGLATFTMRIFYRQNASWQGTLTWNEQQREESFRSVLELLMLMHSALVSRT